MKTKKIFDYQEMPKEIKELVIETYGGSRNGSFVEVYVLEAGKPIELVEPDKCSYKDNLTLYPNTGEEIIDEYTTSGVRYVKQRGDDPIGDWLYDNGAKVDEEVLIKN